MPRPVKKPGSAVRPICHNQQQCGIRQLAEICIETRMPPHKMPEPMRNPVCIINLQLKVEREQIRQIHGFMDLFNQGTTVASWHNNEGSFTLWQGCERNATIKWEVYWITNFELSAAVLCLKIILYKLHHQ